MDPEDGAPRPLLVVDAANVVGSVPDGWWRDRRGATERLRDALVARAGEAEVVLVVEGAARGVDPVPGVRVVAAPGSGDDTVVEVVEREGAGREVVVATADRELVERVRRAGAEVVGPRTVRGPVPRGRRRSSQTPSTEPPERQ